MPNKKESRGRGRPRKFDESAVLLQAEKIFLEQGFENTSYENLALQTGLSKPSLYNAFGDKSALFEKVLSGYSVRARTAALEGFSNSDTFLDASSAFLIAAAEFYSDPQHPSRGCLLIGTALPACLHSEAVKETLSSFCSDLEAGLEHTIQDRFIADAEIRGRSPRDLALQLSSLLFMLAVKARSGLSRAELIAIARELAGTLR